MSRRSDTRRAREALKAARQALAATAGAAEETNAYLDANARVITAERALPWWKRIDIDAGVYDHPPHRPTVLWAACAAVLIGAGVILDGRAGTVLVAFGTAAVAVYLALWAAYLGGPR